MDAIDIKSSHGAEIHIGDGGTAGGTYAAVEWGASTAKIRIKSKKVGTGGNGKNITVVVSGASYVYTILTENEISITVPTTATVAEVIANLYQQANFNEFWDADFGATPGDGTGTITARTVTATSGGTFGSEVFDGLNGIHNGPNGPGFEPQIQEATHHGTEDTIRRLSRVNKTAVSFDIYFDPDNVEHALLLTNARAGTKTNFLQYLNDGTGDGFSYSAYIAMSPAAPVDGFNVYSVTLSIDGEVGDI